VDGRHNAVVIAETTQTLWLYYVVFAILALSFSLRLRRAAGDKSA
jgi:hypothetical protein